VFSFSPLRLSTVALPPEQRQTVKTRVGRDPDVFRLSADAGPR